MSIYENDWESLGALYGIKRKQWWIFMESDKSFKKRIYTFLKNYRPKDSRNRK
jgi:hypothetical protein